MSGKIDKNTVECAHQALIRMKELYEGRHSRHSEIDVEMNHFNADLGTCFVQIQVVDSDAATNASSLAVTVYDAFEGKPYAYYSIVFDPQLDTPPTCSVLGSDGKLQECSSRDEFDRLVERFMGPTRDILRMIR